MSTVLLDAERNQHEPEAAGIRLYTFVCMASALLLTLPLLARGLGANVFLPALIALLLPVLRWRIGPALLHLSLLWIVVIDSTGMNSIEILYQVNRSLNWLMQGQFILPYFPRNPSPRLLRAVPMLDILFCMALLVWIASYFRLLGVTHSIFPLDRRRRELARQRNRTDGSSQESRVVPRRSPELVSWSEPAWVISISLGCAVLSEAIWAWLRRQTSQADLAFVVPTGIRVQFYDRIWQLIVLLWLFSILLIVAVGVLAYLGTLRLTPAEAALYLQDQVWRQTRREQARLNRWLTWAEKRQARRRAKK
jgi:hypothetical protein